MAYLESRLNVKAFVEPLKETTGKGYDPVLLVSGNVEPENKHSFNKWNNYISWHLFNVSRSINQRCQQQCHRDTAFLHGKSVGQYHDLANKCENECNGKWLGIASYKRESLVNIADQKFNECLGKFNHLDYGKEELLKCKKDAFLSFSDDMLDFEQEMLNDALNKYD